MIRRVLRLLGTAAFVLTLLAAAGGIAKAEAQTEWLSINEYRLYFSGEITDGIYWKAVEDTPQLDAVFYLQLREVIEVPLFTVTLHQEQGDYAITLTGPDGVPVPVSFEMADRPPGLTDEEKWTFSWAQADVYLLMETLVLAEVGDAQGAEASFGIVTDAYELTYSARWKDQIQVAPDEDGNVTFLVTIGSRQYPLFSLVYDNSGGDYVITLSNARGTRVNLSFYMAGVPESLDAQERRTFSRAQEAVNEIAKTIVLR